MLTARKWDALVALLPVESDLAATFVRSFTVAIHWITSTATNGNIAEISLPSRQTLDLSIVVADVVRGTVRGLRHLTGLKVTKRGGV